jgi:hypothetical protein
VTSAPHFGHTKIRTPLHPRGLPVHLHAADHLPGDTRVQRFNKACAVWITKRVGSMPAFWLFTLASALVAPSCLYAAGYIHWHSFITTFGFELLATLILSTWLELALMPAIMVQGNIAAAASDARAAKTFEDAEAIKAIVAELQGDVAAIRAAVAPSRTLTRPSDRKDQP